MAVVDTLYRLNGTELTTQARRNLHAYLDDNPRGKRGAVVYDLPGNFGRTADEIRSRFGFYIDRFDVRIQ
jgi:hypothetical protein